jgi:hypothetical protein
VRATSAPPHPSTATAPTATTRGPPLPHVRSPVTSSPPRCQVTHLGRRPKSPAPRDPRPTRPSFRGRVDRIPSSIAPSKPLATIAAPAITRCPRRVWGVARSQGERWLPEAQKGERRRCAGRTTSDPPPLRPATAPTVTTRGPPPPHVRSPVTSSPPRCQVIHLGRRAGGPTPQPHEIPSDRTHLPRASGPHPLLNRAFSASGNHRCPGDHQVPTPNPPAALRAPRPHALPYRQTVSSSGPGVAVLVMLMLAKRTISSPIFS